MLTGDIERAAELAENLTDRRRILAAILDKTPAEIRLSFADAEGAIANSEMAVSLVDLQYGPLFSLAQKILKEDIAELSDALRSMGVRPDA